MYCCCIKCVLCIVVSSAVYCCTCYSSMTKHLVFFQTTLKHHFKKMRRLASGPQKSLVWWGIIYGGFMGAGSGPIGRGSLRGRGMSSRGTTTAPSLRASGSTTLGWKERASCFILGAIAKAKKDRSMHHRYCTGPLRWLGCHVWGSFKGIIN